MGRGPTPGVDVLTLTDLGDDELAAAAGTGDQEAFGVLVARMTPILLRYLRRMVGDRQTAEDLTQETLLDAWKGLPDFNFRSSFRTWMFAIAYRKSVDSLRRRRDIPTGAEHFADLTAPQPQPADEVMRRSLVDALRVELAAMPPASRAAWWLREVEGLSLTEISRVLQISVGSVRGHLQRSRRYLAARLAPWRPDPGGSGTQTRGAGSRGAGTHAAGTREAGTPETGTGMGTNGTGAPR